MGLFIQKKIPFYNFILFLYKKKDVTYGLFLKPPGFFGA